MTKSKDSPYPIPADRSDRATEVLVENGQGVRKFLAERQKLETPAPAAAVETPSKKFEPARVKFPTSPILAKSPDQLEKAYVPPRHIRLPSAGSQESIADSRERLHRSSRPRLGQPATFQINVAKPVLPTAPQAQPKNEAKPATGAPKGTTQGQTPGPAPGRAAKGNPPAGASTPISRVYRKDNSKAQPKK